VECGAENIGSGWDYKKYINERKKGLAEVA
jgi:hypothetical protein